MKTGRIYKIIHNQSNICYVGSTFDKLRYRFRTHKSKSNNTCIGKYIQKYGKKNFTIMLIKEYQVCDRKQLNAWEQLWINRLTCINEIGSISFLWINKLKKIYYDKKWREDNKEQIKKYRKKHYQKNKEKILKKRKEKIKCESCNCMIIKHSIREHERTKKHINNIQK